ncbi:MAG: acyl-CoA dehydrogenase [Ideonella sp.]|nr:acyl-CoA dehydrogenase [Ideonella sp.]
MALTLEQQHIADSAAELLGQRAGSAAVRAAIEQGGFDRDLWQQVAELGWCGVHLPEQHGGLGLGLTELCLLAEALGRHLAPVPWFETAVLAGLALKALPAVGPGEDHAGRVLQRIASGACVATLSLGDDALRWTGRHGALRATAAGEGWRVEGVTAPLPAAAAADLLLLTASTASGEPLLLAVPGDAAGLSVQRVANHDLTRPLARVGLAGVALPGAACLARGPAVDALLQGVQQRAAIVLAAEQLGVAQRSLDLAVAYTGERTQFGQPVARFQAVKHRCAQTMVAVELARSAVLGAAAAVDAGAQDADLARAAAMARCHAADAARVATQESIQLHGGMGYTWDCDAHLHFKRAQAASQWLGPCGEWLDRVADAMATTADAERAPVAAPANEPAPDAALRGEVLQWMQQHLQGRFAALRHQGGPGDAGFSADLAKAWEQQLAAGGWVGIGWPRRFGGRELPIAQQVVVHEAYARAGGPGRLGHIGEHLLAPTLMAFGTPEQQQRFLPGIRAGTEYWAQGYSEPNAGSDLANVQTRARLERAAWVIDGQKVWTSWAREADWIFVLARTEPGSLRHQGLSLLLVPLRQPGITIRPIRQITGGAEFNEVFFDGARTEASLCLGAPGQGWKVAMALLGFERGVSTLGQQAHFEGELNDLIAVARRNGALADPVLRRRIAQAALALQAQRCNALRVLDAAEGATPGREALVAKYIWSNWRRDLGALAADVMGLHTDAIDDEPSAQRLRALWLTSRADTVYAGSNEIQLNLIAERGLGMPR